MARTFFPANGTNLTAFSEDRKKKAWLHWTVLMDLHKKMQECGR